MLVVLLASVGLLSACASGSDASAATAEPVVDVDAAGPWPAAAPADVRSVDAIIGALYDVISGPAGEARDWDRFRSLFIPDGRLTAVGVTQEGEVRHRAMSVEDYITFAGPGLERNGFFEQEIGRTEERFGHVADLMSAYDSRQTPEAEPFSRGVNSIQLLHDGERWWVVSILWDSEREGNPIPERYLGGR